MKTAKQNAELIQILESKIGVLAQALGEFMEMSIRLMPPEVQKDAAPLLKALENELDVKTGP